MPRKPKHRYLDPLDAVWLTAAARVGFAVERSHEVYAATDGRGTLWIGTPETLDPDDCLAQMILHELCHSLIEGEASLDVPDFGLDNQSDADVVREHACLRLQAWLADAHGLRHVLAPTTEFRTYYDALPEDPLAADEPVAAAARAGAERSTGPPWAPHLQRALSATAAITEAAAAFGAHDPADPRPPIWRTENDELPGGR